MKICRVLGNVTATVKHPAFAGRRLLIVQPIDEDGSDAGESFLAIDEVQAGAGERVLVMREGNGVRQILNLGPTVPVRSMIVGIVDSIEKG